MLEGNAYGGQFESRVGALGFGNEVLLSRWRFGPAGAGEAYLEFWTHSLAQYREEMERFFQVYESIAGSLQPYGTFGTLEGGKNGH